MDTPSNAGDKPVILYGKYVGTNDLDLPRDFIEAIRRLRRVKKRLKEIRDAHEGQRRTLTKNAEYVDLFEEMKQLEEDEQLLQGQVNVKLLIKTPEGVILAVVEGADAEEAHDNLHVDYRVELEGVFLEEESAEASSEEGTEVSSEEGAEVKMREFLVERLEVLLGGGQRDQDGSKHPASTSAAPEVDATEPAAGEVDPQTTGEGA